MQRSLVCNIPYVQSILDFVFSLSKITISPKIKTEEGARWLIYLQFDFHNMFSLSSLKYIQSPISGRSHLCTGFKTVFFFRYMFTIDVFTFSASDADLTLYLSRYLALLTAIQSELHYQCTLTRLVMMRTFSFISCISPFFLSKLVI